MLELEYFWQTMLVARLLMPWILVSPSHQQPLYWLFMIARSLSSTRKTTEAIWGLRNDRKWKYILCFLTTIQHIKGFLLTQQCHPKPLLHSIYVRKKKIHLCFRSFLNIVLWVQILTLFAHLLLLCLCNIMQYFLIQLILLMLLISIIEIHYNCIFFKQQYQIQKSVLTIYFWKNTPFPCDQGAVSIRKTVLPGMAIPMLKIRRPNGRLIFNMEIAIRR